MTDFSYSGAYDHTVDPKGRVVVPAAFRDRYRAGGQLLLRLNHIALYDADSWQLFLVKLRALRDQGGISRPDFNELMSYSTSVQPDAQGRFGLPPRLRQVVDIETDVVILGHDDYLGVYAPQHAPLPARDRVERLMRTVDGLPL